MVGFQLRILGKERLPRDLRLMTGFPIIIANMKTTSLRLQHNWERCKVWLTLPDTPPLPDPVRVSPRFHCLPYCLYFILACLGTS